MSRIEHNAEEAARIWSGEDREDVEIDRCIRKEPVLQEKTFFSEYIWRPISWTFFGVLVVVTSPVWVPVCLFIELNRYLTEKFVKDDND